VELGVVIPQGRLQLDRGALRAFAQAAEDLGFGYVFSFDHVLGADPSVHADRPLPFTTSDPFYELFSLFSFLTACAPELGFCTGILIVPQRQTALVAKQAAQVDLLSGGKLRIGVGTGWNEVEYEALGVPWPRRGRRLDEQLEVLKRLWTEESVTFKGEFHRFAGAGINPLPVQRPIPIWIGGHSAPSFRRAAERGDGYLVPGQPPVDPAASRWPDVFREIEALRREAGRTGPFGFEARPVPEDDDGWEAAVRAWEEVGATHVSVTTLGALRGSPDQRDRERELDASTTVDDHIASLARAAESLSAYLG
jgi:probable F420-dependent oxidoreductase